VFVMKKIISGMLMPLPLVLELLVAGLVLLWFTRRQTLGKVIVTIGTVLLLIEGFGLLAYATLARLEGMYGPLDLSEAREAKVKWVVVLSAGHYSTEEALPVTSTLVPETQARLNEGIRIFRGLPGSRLVVSGGKVFGTVSSAELMARLASEVGLDPKRIVLEDRSRDTGEEAELIAPMVGREPFILVTSAYHMPRSMVLFKARGLNPVPAPTGHYAVDADSLSPATFFPRADGIRICEIVAHEVLGLLAIQVREAFAG
jgi:uncharacterized SAM-binding protein YcdF (DUF218 family)